MSTSTESRTHVTPLYPGPFFPERGQGKRIEGSPSAEDLIALFPSDGWFAVEVRTQDWKRWTDDEGNEEWRATGKPTTRRVYVGEVLTQEDVQALPGDHSILLSNMRGNGWERVVHTRAGNWQPLERGDAVVDPALDADPA